MDVNGRLIAIKAKSEEHADKIIRYFRSKGFGVDVYSPACKGYVYRASLRSKALLYNTHEDYIPHEYTIIHEIPNYTPNYEIF